MKLKNNDAHCRVMHYGSPLLKKMRALFSFPGPEITISQTRTCLGHQTAVVWREIESRLSSQDGIAMGIGNHLEASIKVKSEMVHLEVYH